MSDNKFDQYRTEVCPEIEKISQQANKYYDNVHKRNKTQS